MAWQRPAGGRTAWRREVLFVALCFAAASAIPFLPDTARARFSLYAAGAPPLLMLAVATVAGAAALRLLRQRGFFMRGRMRIGAVAVLATVFALPAVVADIAHPYPATINIAWPEAWLFYPAIAIVAIAMLQLVPLAAAHLATSRGLAAILLAALAEPALQLAFAQGLPRWQAAFMGLHVYAFGVVAMLLLRRHGLIAMLAFRLVYYLHWHILWGQLRLALPAPGP